MSSLASNEKLCLEKSLGMGGGYVLDFTSATFDDFFGRHNIDIHGHQYQALVTSKAIRLCAFWSLEPDWRVGKLLSEMLDCHEVFCDLNDKEPDEHTAKVCFQVLKAVLAGLAGER